MSWSSSSASVEWEGHGVAVEPQQSRYSWKQREQVPSAPVALSVLPLCFLLLPPPGRSLRERVLSLSFHPESVQLWLPLTPNLVCDVETGGVFGAGVEVPLPTGGSRTSPPVSNTSLGLAIPSNVVLMLPVALMAVPHCAQFASGGFILSLCHTDTFVTLAHTAPAPSWRSFVSPAGNLC